MIARLRGTLYEGQAGAVVIDCGGVGYEVFLPEHVHAQLVTGQEATLLTRQVFREDGVTLYGFLLPFQRRMFDLLLEVKGCGPKVAMSLLGQVGEDSVAQAILVADAKILTRATGVGARLAERILLELKDKVQEESLVRKIQTASSGRAASKSDDEVVEALLGLGYRRQEAEDAAAKADGNGSVEERLRTALQVLRKA